ncbi:pyridoxamine 5'-phosphate oxidase family protein (plasmid) [Embleya sp. NBC_00888]|uniref:pyridoxamine 5'-phosphate oxidase family protein n=1 Tax=Embleya sp. NBC_00888 TaxID=2975960 RepID=UPI002F91B58A|nr:pyridoxamine 5'-phosphate oxidase family protein [Embleya sp. NBC_00888]
MIDRPTTRRPLGRREALDLMTGVPVGRVVVTEDALPAVYPVLFAVDGDCVVFRTLFDSALAHAALDTIVAFQADRIDAAARTGWTATVTGTSSPVDNQAEIERLDRLLPTEPGDEAKYTWIQVTSELVNGLLVQRPGDS